MATASLSRCPTRSATTCRRSAATSTSRGVTTTARFSQQPHHAVHFPQRRLQSRLHRQEHTDMPTTRLAASLAVAALAVFSAFSAASQAAETLSVVTFGGAYAAAAKNAYFEPFTAQTGIGFSSESYDGGLAKLSAMEQAKNTTWDLIDLETNDAITACDEGLLKKFDRKTLGKTSDFIPGSISDCAVASMVWSTVYAYDTSKLKSA